MKTGYFTYIQQRCEWGCCADCLSEFFFLYIDKMVGWDKVMEKSRTLSELKISRLASGQFNDLLCLLV